MIIPIKSLKGKEAGWIDTNIKTYKSERNPEHFMRLYQGFGISESVLSQLIGKVEDVLIIYTAQNKKKHRYISKLSQFLKSDKVYDNKEGGILDPQRFVSVKDMKEI